MTRHVFNAAAVVSLLLCVAVGGRWVWNAWPWRSTGVQPGEVYHVIGDIDIELDGAGTLGSDLARLRAMIETAGGRVTDNPATRVDKLVVGVRPTKSLGGEDPQAILEAMTQRERVRRFDETLAESRERGVTVISLDHFLSEIGYNRAKAPLSLREVALLVACIGFLLLWLWSRWNHHRYPHACLACGYDLRGTPGIACPECGARRPEAERRAV